MTATDVYLWDETAFGPNDVVLRTSAPLIVAPVSAGARTPPRPRPRRPEPLRLHHHTALRVHGSHTSAIHLRTTTRLALRSTSTCEIRDNPDDEALIALIAAYLLEDQT